MESEGHNSQLSSGCSTQGNSKVRLPSDAIAEGETRGSFGTSGASNDPFMGPKEELGENHEDSNYLESGKQLTLANDKRSQDEISNQEAGSFQKVKTLDQNELNSNDEAHYCSSETMDVETPSPSVSRKDVVIAVPIRGCVDERTEVVQAFKEETKQIGLRLGDDKKRLASRSSSPAIRTRSSFPEAENEDRNKRPLAICDFFAKGWCIKGNSCKFLHVKDDVNNTTQQHGGQVAAATMRRESLIDEEMIVPQEQGERKALLQLQENHKLSRENLPGNEGNYASPINRYTFPISRNSLLPRYGSSSSGSAIPSNNCYGGNPSSNLGHLNSSLSTSGPTTSSSPCHHVSAWTGSLMPLNSFSLNSSPLGTQKMPQNDKEYRTSTSALLLRSSSPFSGSDPEKPLRSADYTIKMLSNDWEPSVPFRPSFFIPPAFLSSSGGQYDSLPNSFEFSNTRDLSSTFLFSSVGTSTVNTSHQKIYGDSILSRTVGPETNGDKSSASNENVLGNDSNTPGKDSHTAGDIVGTSIGDGQNGIVPKGDELSVCTHTKVLKPKRHDGRQSNDGSRHHKDLKLDRLRQNNEMDVERKTEGDVRKESKAMRHLRAELVDLVKELLKPAWREGHLSKDAHNAIVKKAVDKVLSALQPHQTPTTVESAKHYLSSSQPKIAKLVEGYVGKYGKS